MVENLECLLDLNLKSLAYYEIEAIEIGSCCLKYNKHNQLCVCGCGWVGVHVCVFGLKSLKFII